MVEYNERHIDKRQKKEGISIMDQKILEDTIEKTKELMQAPSCCNEAKTAAQDWLNALGTEKEAAETKEYLHELEEDIMPIDNLIRFAESDGGKKAFGADTARNMADHAKGIRSAGAKYCDCPACSAAAAILEKKDLLLK